MYDGSGSSGSSGGDGGDGGARNRSCFQLEANPGERASMVSACSWHLIQMRTCGLSAGSVVCEAVQVGYRMVGIQWMVWPA